MDALRGPTLCPQPRSVQQEMGPGPGSPPGRASACCTEMVGHWGKERRTWFSLKLDLLPPPQPFEKCSRNAWFVSVHIPWLFAPRRLLRQLCQGQMGRELGEGCRRMLPLNFAVLAAEEVGVGLPSASPTSSYNPGSSRWLVL